MAKRIDARQRRTERHHERPPDPAEASDRPLEPKVAPRRPGPGRDPHEALNRPVGEPDPTADSDPYAPEDVEEPPPPA
jgi:hypothetical protein